MERVVSDSRASAGWFANLRVRVKVFVAVGVTAVTTLGVAGVSIYEMGRLNDNTQTVTEGNVARLNQVADLRQAITSMTSNGLLMQTPMGAADAARYQREFEAAIGQIDERFNAYREADLTDPRWVAGTEKFATNWAEFNALLAELNRNPQDPAVQAKSAQIIELMAEIDSAVSELTGVRARRRPDASRSGPRDAYREGRLTTMIALPSAWSSPARSRCGSRPASCVRCATCSGWSARWPRAT